MKLICKIKDNLWVNYEEEYYPLAISFSLKRGIDICIQVGEDGMPGWSSLVGFEVIDQTIPSCWVRDVHEDPTYGIITYLPAKWAYHGFFEDLSNDIPAAVALFNEEAIKIYKELKAPGYEQD
jgi:hypothetical protein